jgi:glycosyltransferase involved in cell wall biosynthesis
MHPLVSILLPCYNTEKYLRYSLDSILNQDYKNLEILCINDGSSDSTLDILNIYKSKDARIVIINNETNLGLIHSLNKALKLVKGEYFARMDADDYSTPDRISKQVNFIDSQPDIDLVSSAYNYFLVDGQKKEYIPPIAFKSNSLKFLSLFCTPLTHASILGKSSLIHSGLFEYDNDYPYAEDFELFSRLAWNGVKISTMAESLYWVRLHSESVSVKHNSIQFQTNLSIIERNIYNYVKVPVVLDDTLKGLLACRINSIISFEQVINAFSIFDKCIDKIKGDLKAEEMQEIKRYLLSHKLNILIQVNKKRFKVLGFKNIPFFIKSFFCMNFDQFFLLFRKLRN